MNAVFKRPLRCGPKEPLVKSSTSKSKSARKSASKTKPAAAPKPRRKSRAIPKLTARTADPFKLYEMAVQSPDAEIDFVDSTYRKIRGKHATLLREDFCASAATACEWVKRRKDNRSIGLDLDAKVLKWGDTNNRQPLGEAASRVQMLKRNVLEPGDATGVDIVLSMNFSYWLFQERELLISYFRKVRDSLNDDGVYFLDAYGGWESMKVMTERRRIKGGFTYIWEQAGFDPISNEQLCYISFAFPDKTSIKRVFSYRWRLWTIPEITEMLSTAGFKNVKVYWEGDDGKGGGNGVFKHRTKGEDGPSFIVYLSAEK